MKLFGKKEWIRAIISVVLGIIVSGYIICDKFGTKMLWILLPSTIIALIVIILISRYSNKN